MKIIKSFNDFSDFDPISIVEKLSHSKDWGFDRVDENKINISIQGMWHTYSLEIDYLKNSDDLCLLCFFNFNLPQKKHFNFLKLLNIVNSENLNGTFFYFFQNNLLTFKNKLSEISNNENINKNIFECIERNILICDRFYPAFQLISWTNEVPEKAMNFAFDTPMGSA